jgi:hypothetical protein
MALFHGAPGTCYVSAGTADAGLLPTHAKFGWLVSTNGVTA